MTFEVLPKVPRSRTKKKKTTRQRSGRARMVQPTIQPTACDVLCDFRELWQSRWCCQVVVPNPGTLSLQRPPCRIEIDNGKRAYDQRSSAALSC